MFYSAQKHKSQRVWDNKFVQKYLVLFFQKITKQDKYTWEAKLCNIIKLVFLKIFIELSLFLLPHGQTFSLFIHFKHKPC